MNHSNALLEKLTSSSLRQNKGLIVLVGLVLLLLGIGYLGVQRMVDEHRDITSFHFARLMENIQEQETFLGNILRKSAGGNLSPSTALPPYLQKPLPEEGPNIYEGREFPLSCPTALKSIPRKLLSANIRKSLPSVPTWPAITVPSGRRHTISRPRSFCSMARATSRSRCQPPGDCAAQTKYRAARLPK